MNYKKEFPELSEKELEAYEKLKESIQAPENLKENILNKLEKRNLIQSSKISTIMYQTAAVAAALLIGFFAGIYNTDKSQTPMIKNDQNEYLLILYNDGFSSNKGETELTKEYTVWMEGLKETGNYLSANRLSDESRLLGQHLSDSEKLDVGGYYLITASDLDQAVQIAETHPQIKYNGGIEVRPIFQNE